ncbi:transposase, partial [Thermus scotoductus]|uniref:transposase n=1 Tax=Thermus scotoductus TaxID=37636 RepID=UPI0020A5D09E
MGWSVERMLRELRRDPSLLGDSAYDAEGLFQAAEEKGLLLLSGHNRRRGKPRGRRRGENLRRLQREAYRRLYRRR